MEQNELDSRIIKHLASKLEGADSLLLEVFIRSLEEPEKQSAAGEMKLEDQLTIANAVLANREEQIILLDREIAELRGRLMSINANWNQGRIDELEQENLRLETDNATILTANHRLEKEIAALKANSQKPPVVNLNSQPEKEPLAVAAKPATSKPQPVWEKPFTQNEAFYAITALIEGQTTDVVAKDLGIPIDKARKIAQTYGATIGNGRATSKGLARDTFIEKLKANIFAYSPSAVAA